MEGLNRDTGPNQILIKTALDNLRTSEDVKTYSRTGKVEATDPIVFSQDAQSAQGKGIVQNSVLGGGGYFQKSTDDLAPKKESVKRAATPKNVVIAEFSKDLDISRTFMADQQQSTVAKAVKDDVRTWYATRDRNAVYTFANGFVTTYPNSLTIDGVALFSNSHVNQNGDTIDNLETGVLGNDNLNVVVNSLRTQVAQSGVKIGYEPDFLLTPSLIHQTGMQVAKSVLRAGGSLNDLNYWSEMYPGMKVVFSPFVDEISTTEYVVGAAGHGVIRYEREAFFTKLVDWESQRNDVYIYKMRAREEVDALEYSGLVGSNGTV